MRGHVRERGAGNWYAVLSVRDKTTGKRKTVWKSLPGCKGKREAEAECRKLVGQLDAGDFVMSDNVTVRQWAEHWISIGCPGKKRKAVANRTRERYSEILRNYILPTLGSVQLQKLQATEIDGLYTELAKRLKPLTLLNTHIVFSSCISTAVRQRKIQRNPMQDLAKVPPAEEADHGAVLDKDELAAFVKGCRDFGTSLFPIVATLAWTGMRRSECLALRWEDFDAKAKTLSITRAVDETKAGLSIKGPKKASHARTIAISDDLVSLLLAERDRHLRTGRRGRWQHCGSALG